MVERGDARETYSLQHNKTGEMNTCTLLTTAEHSGVYE